MAENPKTHPNEDDYLEEYLVHEGQVKRSSAVKRIFYTLIVSIAVIGFALLAFSAYRYGSIPRNPEDLPIIAAALNAYREKPVDAGGMRIPNMDKNVYNHLSSENTLPKVKKLLPAPEEPIARTNLPKSTRTLTPVKSPAPVLKIDDTPKKSVVPTIDTPKTEDDYSTTTEPADDNLGSKKPKSSQQKPIEARKEKVKQQITSSLAYLQQQQQDLEKRLASNPKTTKNPLKPQPKTPPKPTPLSKKDIQYIEPNKAKTKKIETKHIAKQQAIAKAHFTLQLGAFKSKEDAKKAWKKIQQTNKDVLNTISPVIEHADLGNKGIFYRLKAGTFTRESEARNLCNKLRERKQGCFLVKG